MSTGYSGTPLAKKLGIKKGFTILLYNQPSHYFDLFADFPYDRVVKKGDTFKSGSVDFIHLFCTSFKELKDIAFEYKNALKKNGLLWVSWPKGKSGMQTNLKRDLIREYLIKIGLVDVKIASIDKDWSALKFVYRIKDR